jgi:hypothetical protein
LCNTSCRPITVDQRWSLIALNLTQGCFAPREHSATTHRLWMKEGHKSLHAGFLLSLCCGVHTNGQHQSSQC